MRRLAVWCIKLPAVAILLYLIAALVGAVIPHRTDLPLGDRLVKIYLLRGPIHYDFLLPNTAETREQLGFLGKTGIDLANPAAKWIMIGWGGQDFYTTIGTYKDVSARAVWRGVTGDASVMRVSLAGDLRPDAPVLPLRLGRRAYVRLLDNITASFAEGARTEPLNHPGFSPHDKFYPAKGRFHIFRTCNVWIGEMLRGSGVRFGLWTPAPFAVTFSHWLFHAPGTQPP